MLACQVSRWWVTPATTSASLRSPSVTSPTLPLITEGNTYCATPPPAPGVPPAGPSSPAIARPAAIHWSMLSAFMFTLSIRPLSGSGAGTLTPMPPRVTIQGLRPCPGLSAGLSACFSRR